jgi:hypothetical protein
MSRTDTPPDAPASRVIAPTSSYCCPGPKPAALWPMRQGWSSTRGLVPRAGESGRLLHRSGHGHPDKPCQRILCTSVNVCRPYVLSSTSSSNHAGKRQYDASMHDRRFIGIEGLSLTEHGRHMCTLAQTKSWHGLPRRASERAPGLFASRAGSWWRPQRRRCATGLVVLLGWCDHPVTQYPGATFLDVFEKEGPVT